MTRRLAYRVYRELSSCACFSAKLNKQNSVPDAKHACQCSQSYVLLSSHEDKRFVDMYQHRHPFTFRASLWQALTYRLLSILPKLLCWYHVPSQTVLVLCTVWCTCLSVPQASTHPRDATVACITCLTLFPCKQFIAYPRPNPGLI